MNDLDIESKFDPFLKLKMGKADEYLENERLEELKHQEFLKENQAYRDQLEVEVTQSVIKKMFTTNIKIILELLNELRNYDEKILECSDFPRPYKLYKSQIITYRL